MLNAVAHRGVALEGKLTRNHFVHYNAERIDVRAFIDRITHLAANLRAIESIDTIRLASRVPVTLPMRVTDELLRALRPYHPLWVMTHFNHPKEVTSESVAACVRLADAGFPVMNQSVLLAGINDDADVLETLFRGLVRARVRPYYLLQADPVRGSSHLRTPLARGVEIMERLQGRLSGIALPKLICDTPGGRGKVPLGPDYVVARAPGRTTLRTFRGERVDYVDASSGLVQRGLVQPPLRPSGVDGLVQPPLRVDGLVQPPLRPSGVAFVSPLRGSAPADAVTRPAPGGSAAAPPVEPPSRKRGEP